MTLEDLRGIVLGIATWGTLASCFLAIVGVPLLLVRAFWRSLYG